MMDTRSFEEQIATAEFYADCRKEDELLRQIKDEDWEKLEHLSRGEHCENCKHAYKGQWLYCSLKRYADGKYHLPTLEREWCEKWEEREGC